MDSIRLKTSEKVTRCIISLVCLAMGGISAWLLYLDLTRGGAAHGGASVAKAEAIEGRVKRRPPSGYLWENVAPGQELFKRESVQVAESGSATLKFHDGRSLEISENSLVILEDTQGMELKFIRGVFYLHGDGVEKKITAEAGKELKVETIPFKLKSPPSGSRFFVNTASKETFSVPFKWKRLTQEDKRAEPLTLEISSQRDFSAPLTETVPATSSETMRDMPAGKYFWRIRGSNEVRSFEILGVKTTVLKTPVEGETLESGPKGLELTWDWGGIPRNTLELGKHFVEYASSADFSKQLVSVPTEASARSLRTSALKTGKYFWRVRSQYPGVEVTSAVWPFNHVFQPADETIPVIGPLAEWELHWTASEKIPFSWHRRAGETPLSEPVELKLWKDLERKEAVGKWTSAEGRFELAENLLEPRTYFWEVVVPGSSTKKSSLRPLVIRAPVWKSQLFGAEPKEGHHFVGVKAKTCKLSWEAKEGFQQYEIVVRDSQREVYRTVTNRNEVNLTGLGQGAYEWSVKAKDRWKREVPWTAPRMFIVDYGPRLRAPALSDKRPSKAKGGRP